MKKKPEFLVELETADGKLPGNSEQELYWLLTATVDYLLFGAEACLILMSALLCGAGLCCAATSSTSRLKGQITLIKP